ncbi:hypothetical protein BH09PSE5_BH09PSE5_39790 [soil metagenome]
MAQAFAFMAWHYTTGDRFMQILKQRAIVPAESADAAHGRPVIWFSVNDEFEPSACLVVRGENGSARHFSVSETAEQGLGLVRLGVPVRTLLTCTELRRRAGIPAEAWAGMCEEARLQGSDPDQWFGCMNPVPIDKVVVEVRDDDASGWKRMQSGVVARYPQQRANSSGGRNGGPTHLAGR